MHGTSPMTYTYHLEHTLFPCISYSLLPILAPICEKIAKKHFIKYNKITTIHELVSKQQDSLKKYETGSHSSDTIKTKLQ
jgi:hypothetical protein